VVTSSNPKENSHLGLGIDSWDVRILTASYRREPVDGPEENQEPIIQLFGRTRDGRSIAIEYAGFKPYFFVVAPSQALRGAFARDKQVIGFEDVTLEFEGKPTLCARVTLRQPWKTPEYREKARGFGSTPLEADIPFQHRFIYDKDLGAAVRVVGTASDPAGRYTTDLFAKAERFEPCDPFRPTMRILSFDIENSIRDGHIFCIGVAYRDGQPIKTEALTGTEPHIIERFVKLVEELDPDIISGYNIDGYDLHVLLERAEKNGMPRLALARDHSSFFHLGERFWRLDGRILTDVWWAVKAERHLKQETLDYVAKQLLGEGKHELQRGKIDEEWEHDQNKVIRYCVNDAELSLRILEKVRRIEKTLDLSAVSMLPLEDVLHGRTSNLIDSILIRAADRAKVAVPMMKMRGGRVEQIEGGYVHSLQPGLYEWVIALDFRAMYPSLIIENNICFTTVSPNGTVVSPTGARFLSADAKKGLMPSILAKLMKDRENVRVKMRQETDAQMKEFYDGLQAAIKVLMNAFYGVLASSFYRFNDPKVGASVTAFARERIKGIIGELEAESVKVVYADTDSVFFQSPVAGTSGALEFAKGTAERFSKGRISMEVDKIYRTLFSHGRKKRYAGKVAWPTEGEIVVRGYEVRRTDAFDLQTEAQMQVFERILSNEIDEAIAVAKGLIAGIRAGKPPLSEPERDPIESLVISRTVKPYVTKEMLSNQQWLVGEKPGRDEEDRRRRQGHYLRPSSLTNIKAAEKLVKMGEEFVPGMKVSWIVTNHKTSPMEVEPYVSGHRFEKQPDWEYYSRRVAQTLGSATEVYGWDEKALFTGTQPAQQKSLDSEDFSQTETPADGPRRSEKKLTLEDFF
jgi:DNA polymerase I